MKDSLEKIKKEINDKNGLDEKDREEILKRILEEERK